MTDAKTFTAITEYFKTHWIAMLFAAIPTAIVVISSFVITLANIIGDYDALKLTVEANATTTHDLETQLEDGQITENSNISRLVQQGKDQQNQLNLVSGQVDTIYNYVLVQH